MNEEKFEERKIGKVKAAISSYRERMNVEGNNPANKKFQAHYLEKPNNKTRELHEAKRDTNQFNHITKLAESKLSAAKKTIKDLTRKIEESNSRAEVQKMYLEKLKTAKRKEEEMNSSGNSQSAKVMKELEKIKQDLSKLKLDIASVSEEKRKSEHESESYTLKAISCSNSVEKLAKEIEEIHEEHVLVELARIEAIKEFRECEIERRENGEKYLRLIDEAEKRKKDLIHEIEVSKDLEKQLAITSSDINFLKNELNQGKEIDKGQQKIEEHRIDPLKIELEAANKELDSIKEERSQFMVSMDIVRNELRHVIEETSRLKEKEEKTDLIIQNLNSNLLRSRDKLESVSKAAEKSKSIESNLSHTLKHLTSESESANEERLSLIEESARTKAEIQKTENATDLAEENLESAIQDLKAVKSSEAIALDNLKAIIERTIRARASTSKMNSTITITKFEYDYLTGHASGAIEIADKKVEAAKAWVEALKASEKEIMMKTELLRRESREIKDGKKSTVDDHEFEKWMDKMEFDDITSVKKKDRKSSGFRSNTPRTTSFSVGRRRKVMPNLAKFLSGKRNV